MTAAGIPYEGTDCTADEAVEAVKAVRAPTAALDEAGFGQCAEVYDFNIGNKTILCQRDPDHDGPHSWIGQDGVGNRVCLDWEFTNE